MSAMHAPMAQILMLAPGWSPRTSAINWQLNAGGSVARRLSISFDTTPLQEQATYVHLRNVSRAHQLSNLNPTWSDHQFSWVHLHITEPQYGN